MAKTSIRMKHAIGWLHDRWANLNPWLRLLVILAVLAAVFMAMLRPGYRHFTKMRAKQRVKEAGVAIEAENYDKARDLSLSALSSGEAGVEAYRVLQQAMSGLNDPKLGGVSRALVVHPESSESDRIRGFEELCEGEPMSVIGQAWTFLGEPLQRKEAFALPFAKRLLDDGRLNEAALVMKPFFNQKIGGLMAEQLFRLMLGMSDERSGMNAQKLLAECVKYDQKWSVNWISRLNEVPIFQLQPDIIAPVYRKLIEDPNEVEVELLKARYRIVSNFDNRSKSIDDALGELAASYPESALRLIDDLDLVDRLEDLQIVEKLVTKGSSFERLLGLLAHAENWSEMKTLLSEHPNVLSVVRQHLWLACVAAGLGDTGTLATEWSRAMDEARSGQDRNPYLELYQFAKKYNMAKQEDEAIVEAARLGRGRLPLYKTIKPTLVRLASTGQEKTLMELCASYLVVEPNNPVLVTQYAYMACLNDLADLSIVARAIRGLADALPKEVPVLSVLAAVYLCDGKPEKAREIVDALPSDAGRMGLSYQAVILTSRVVNDQLKGDDPTVMDFPWGDLLPSERRKFMGLIQSHAAKSRK